MKLTLAIPEIGHVTRRMAGGIPSVMSQHKLTVCLPFSSFFSGLDDKLHGQPSSRLHLPLLRPGASFVSWGARPLCGDVGC